MIADYCSDLQHIWKRLSVKKKKKSSMYIAHVYLVLYKVYIYTYIYYICVTLPIYTS